MTLTQEVQSYLTHILRESGVSLNPADKIIAAVSGGPDSLTLLHLLARQGLHPAQHILVAHLDHRLRPSSTEEAEQVGRIAAEWGLSYTARAVDIAAFAQAEGLSLEEAGRQARYRFFAQAAAEFDAKFIFTGHHAGDQVETVLMHLVRGSGSAGLRGILPVSPLTGHPDLWLVRPLLNAGREQIEAYCREHNLTPHIDESNTDPTFFRNRLRHHLLPLLESYNPQIRERLLATATVTAADYEWLQRQTAEAWQKILLEKGEGWLRFDLERWRRLHLALRRGTLRMGVAQLRPALRDVGFQTIEQARAVGEQGTVGAEATLPDGITLVVGYSKITLHLPEIDPPSPNFPQLPGDDPLPLPIPGRLPLANGWTLAAERLPNPDLEDLLSNKDPWTAYLDIGGLDRLVVRPRQPGERFQPLGMAGKSKSIRDFMIDRKIPAQLRPRWPIVAAKHLLWIPGAIMDERARVSPKSKQAVKLTMAQENF